MEAPIIILSVAAIESYALHLKAPQKTVTRKGEGNHHLYHPAGNRHRPKSRSGGGIHFGRDHHSGSSDDRYVQHQENLLKIYIKIIPSPGTPAPALDLTFSPNLLIFINIYIMSLARKLRNTLELMFILLSYGKQGGTLWK